MLGPTTFTLKHHFYPIGNTPAVNLLQSGCTFRENGDPVRALLLGCGDPRNLLFTLWCNKDETKWEFMCCDLEIAILARNVLFFSLVIDNLSLTSHASIWNICYHFYITDTDNTLLQAQVSKLIEQSANLEVWSSSVYGAAIKFMNKDTLDRTRDIWSQYLQVAELRKGSEEREHFETEFQFEIDTTIRENHFEKEGPRKGGRKKHGHGLRSAGAHWRRAIQTMTYAFDGFWDHGVIAGNSQDLKALKQDGRRVNPLMAISSAGNTFSIPPTSDPLLGFHIASSFDNEDTFQQQLTDSVVRLAKSQFQEWCMNFGEKVRSRAFMVRLYCGDALRLCYELQHLRDPGIMGPYILRLYASNWHSTPLILDNLDTSNDIHAFDIIDTNNLSDALGILNLLPAISPLLSRNATSTMFTETIYRFTKDPVDTISDILCCDVTTMSLLLGLAPSGYLFGFTADALGLEAERQFTLHRDSDSYHMRIAWRCPNLEDPVGVGLVFEHDELADFFLRLYLKMFDFESASPRAERLLDALNYNRLTFATLVCLAKDYIRPPDHWARFVESLLKRIEDDKILCIGGLQLHELSLHFRLLGSLSQIDLSKSPQEMIFRGQEGFKDGSISSRDRKGNVNLLGQQGVPDVVWVTLSVTRQSLKPLTTCINDGRVGLQIKIWNKKLHSDAYFSSLQCFFGSLVRSSEDRNAHDVLEDKLGWKGSSNLVVTCAIPSRLLSVGSRDDIRVELAVLATGTSVKLYGPLLGRRLVICSYGLDDDNLLVSREPPGFRLPCAIKGVTTTQTAFRPSKQLCFIRMGADSSITTMGIRKKFKSFEKEKAMRARQISPCTISERLGPNEHRRFQFPYPFSLKQATIDRSSKISTLVVSPRSAPNSLDYGGYGINPFPIILDGSEAYPLTLPKVNLNQQPTISAVGPKAVEWIECLMHSMSCARERSYSPEMKSSNDLPALFNIKRYIHNMARSFVNPTPLGRKQTFLFRTHDQRHIATIIFVSALRHNIDQSSVVLDAYVLPFKTENSSLSPVLDELLNHNTTQAVEYTMKEADELAMKQMLPATVEACRKSWNHAPGCEYRQYSSITLFTELSQSPTCSCGEGKDRENFPRVKGWEILSKYATRIALMPLSSVPYVEVHYSEEEQTQHEKSLRSISTLRDVNASLQTLQIVDQVRVGDLRGCKRCGEVPLADMEHKQCARCHAVKYCGSVCQRADWKEHKKICKTSAAST
ncbi:hypothetical protein SBOR_7806 [Sclerotinia borealis F-4128]|uniref:MYND-type domain-containing protein n=1 Tax=Sclerotinia borealis (strain F-4128) TaxID=1432307 RepID=W9C7K8_SCLBF|nr:hypothetical protein SBOR_7806 [Sclerotinia borealis F-4128]